MTFWSGASTGIALANNHPRRRNRIRGWPSKLRRSRAVSAPARQSVHPHDPFPVPFVLRRRKIEKIEQWSKRILVLTQGSSVRPAPVGSKSWGRSGSTNTAQLQIASLFACILLRAHTLHTSCPTPLSGNVRKGHTTRASKSIAVDRVRAESQSPTRTTRCRNGNFAGWSRPRW